MFIVQPTFGYTRDFWRPRRPAPITGGGVRFRVSFDSRRVAAANRTGCGSPGAIYRYVGRYTGRHTAHRRPTVRRSLICGRQNGDKSSVETTSAQTDTTSASGGDNSSVRRRQLQHQVETTPASGGDNFTTRRRQLPETKFQRRRRQLQASGGISSRRQLQR